MDEFERIIAAGFTQAEADEMTIRVFSDPGTWAGAGFIAAAGVLFEVADAVAADAARDGR